MDEKAKYNSQDFKLDQSRLVDVEGVEHDVKFNEADEIVSERWIPVVKKRISNIAEEVVMIQRFDPRQVADFSFSDGANIESVKPGNKSKQKTKTVIENTKPEL